MFDADGRRVDFPEGRHRVEAQTDFAVDYLRTRSGDKPFFLFLSYIEPHWQNDLQRHEAPHGVEERFRDYDTPGDHAGSDGDLIWLKTGWREEYPRYLACVNAVDTAVGRIRGELSALGLEENTLVIYGCDHGCHFGVYNFGCKGSCQDASIRVPLIACGPGFRGGSVIDELVSVIDLPTTFLRAGGALVPASMRGRPLQDLAAGTSADWPDDVFYQLSPNTGRGVRTRRWKYAVGAPWIDIPRRAVSAMLTKRPTSTTWATTRTSGSTWSPTPPTAACGASSLSGCALTWPPSANRTGRQCRPGRGPTGTLG